jgi:hypothetical protein
MREQEINKVIVPRHGSMALQANVLRQAEWRRTI